MVEIFRDNDRLLENMPKNYIAVFFDLIKTGKEERLMKFLSEICVSNEIPYLHNQNSILDTLEIPERFEIILETKVYFLKLNYF